MKYVKTIDQKIQFDVSQVYWFEQDTSHYHIDGLYTYCLFHTGDGSYFKLDLSEQNVDYAFREVIKQDNDFIRKFSFSRQCCFTNLDGYASYSINNHIDSQPDPFNPNIAYGYMRSW